MKEISQIIHQREDRCLLSLQLFLVRDKNIYFKTPSRRPDSREYELIARLLDKNELEFDRKKNPGNCCKIELRDVPQYLLRKKVLSGKIEISENRSHLLLRISDICIFLLLFCDYFIK